MKLKGLLIALAVLGLISLFNTSCKKNTDCIAVVQCMDSTGIGMPGVDVLLYANVKTTTGGTITADLRGNAVTDASGRVSFTFKLPAIYDIKATKKSASTTTATTGSTLTGVSIIKLEEGKTVEKIIAVR